MQFTRKLKIEDYQERGRVVMLYGPRRVGKTTMVKKYIEEAQKKGLKTKYEIGDDLELQTFFAKQSRVKLLEYIKPFDVLVIDEAQLIKNIGIVAKIMIDEFPEKKIILTGSSSFELSQQTGEPLVGRQFTMLLLPVALAEMNLNNYEKNQNLENFLIYGAYPEIISLDDNFKKETRLKELVASYLFKDILALDKIKSPALLLNLLKALAYQIGREVSLSKLATDLGESDHKKIGRYIDLLQKTFIIKKVTAYSGNLRSEIKRNSKYYFYDLGILNALVLDFKSLETRSRYNIGYLWENFIFMEMYKNSNNQRKVYDNFFFWRGPKDLEVDIVIEGLNGKLEASECKYGEEIPSFRLFLEEYPNAKIQIVNPENYLELL